LEDALSASSTIALERAERFEIDGGYRGYEKLSARIPRNVEFSYAGFPDADVPPPGPLPQPVVRCGRSGRGREGQPGALPNDLCLRIYDTASKELDKEASAGISRHACDFVLSNDRLHLRCATGNGLMLNARRLCTGEVVVVAGGDCITVPAARGKAVEIETTFRISTGLVTQVRLEKVS
jgi:hypothetical protein